MRAGEGKMVRISPRNCQLMVQNQSKIGQTNVFVHKTWGGPHGKAADGTETRNLYVYRSTNE